MSYYGPQSGGEGSNTEATASEAKPLPKTSSQQSHRSSVTSLSRLLHQYKFNKQLRKEIRVVAWKDEWELQDVGKGLLSVLDDEDLQQEQQQPSVPSSMSIADALEMITVWKSRLNATQGLPHSIESTAGLAQIYWRDTERRQRRQALCAMSISELRLAYSSAVVRCINGFADTMQQERSMAASVSNLCGHLGIPMWVVDVRHEASHNTLPSIEVLRMAASTLLEFLKTEYWIPTCSDWRKEFELQGAEGDTIDQSFETGKTKEPIELLQEYKACASAWASREMIVVENGDTSASITDTAKRKRTKSGDPGPPKTRILPYDPLFGEVGSLSSSDDNDDEADDDEDVKEGNRGDWDEPMVGNIFGSAIGTNTNRFALLEPPKKKKKKPEVKEKKKKPIRKMPKKQKGEITPTECAKRFVKSTSPHKGYGIAIRFLVWGGIGGAPVGRGVLIPGSEKAFPATQDGLSKCWHRYSPLIHVICPTWPGFCSTLLVHLVDFALSIEEQVVEEGEMDLGSARKLYFLLAWIRLLLSHRFVVTLDEAFSAENSSSEGEKKTKSASSGLMLAKLKHLNCLEYPLYRLLDRCRRWQKISNRTLTIKPDAHHDLRSASHEIRQWLEEILGSQISDMESEGQKLPDANSNSVSLPMDVEHRENLERNGLSLVKGAISLEEMEALLADGAQGPVQQTDDAPIQASTPILAVDVMEDTAAKQVVNITRPAWVRCTNWDSCAIGTLPGYPA